VARHLPPNASARPPETLATIDLTSDRDGADINVDDVSIGKASMTLNRELGKHAFRMFMNDCSNLAAWIAILEAQS